MPAKGGKKKNASKADSDLDQEAAESYIIELPKNVSDLTCPTRAIPAIPESFFKMVVQADDPLFESVQLQDAEIGRWIYHGFECAAPDGSQQVPESLFFLGKVRGMNEDGKMVVDFLAAPYVGEGFDKAERRVFNNDATVFYLEQGKAQAEAFISQGIPGWDQGVNEYYDNMPPDGKDSSVIRLQFLRCTLKRIGALCSVHSWWELVRSSHASFEILDQPSKEAFADLGKKLKAEFFDNASAEVCEGLEDVARAAAIKQIGLAPKNARFVFEAMSQLLKKPDAKASHVEGAAFDSLAKQLAKFETSVKAQLEAISVRISVGAGQQPKQRVAIHKVPGDHACTFYVGEFATRLAKQRDAPPHFALDAALQARAKVVAAANELFKSDREAWDNRHAGEDADAKAYGARMTKPISTLNWGSMVELQYISEFKENENLELRVLDAKGRFMDKAKKHHSHSTWPAEKSNQERQVVFLIHNGNHYDIGKSVGGPLGRQFIFSLQEAAEVEQSLQDLLDQTRKTVTWGPNETASEEEVFEHAMKVLKQNGSAESNPQQEGFVVVKGKKERKKEQAEKKIAKNSSGTFLAPAQIPQAQQALLFQNQQLQQQLLHQQRLQQQQLQQQQLQHQQALPPLTAPLSRPQPRSFAEVLRGPARPARTQPVYAPPPQPVSPTSGQECVVVFLGGKKVQDIQMEMEAHAPGLASAYILKGEGSSERIIAYAQPGPQFQALSQGIQQMRMAGLRATPFKPPGDRTMMQNRKQVVRIPDPSLGLNAAIAAAGLCKYRARGAACPYSPCKFECYGSPSGFIS
jgi:hypothetical protein